MPDPVVFNGGGRGGWKVLRQGATKGEPMAAVTHVDRATTACADATWVVTGVTSNLRYTYAAEKRVLDATPSVLGRLTARRAALNPITKSAAWWALAQDDRRAILQEQPQHIAVGSEYPSLASRQLVHCRDQPGAVFDFLTWFAFAPSGESRFDELLVKLRATPEWWYVEREVEIRLERVP